MTMLLDRPDTSAQGANPTDDGSRPLWRLRTTMAPIRLSFTWFGTQKALTAEQKARAAETFDAQAGALSAGKKLLDTRHTAFRAVTAIRGQIEANWKARTLPFPEPGIRLIRQEDIESFVDQMTILRTELADAVVGLDRHFEELKAAARQRLGSLYHEADYPVTLQGLFDVCWDFPNVEPPDYLMALSPALFAQEEERVRARFEEAVALAEQAFLDEFTTPRRAPPRAHHRLQRRRLAQGLPRLRRGQPPGVLHPLPRPQRPLEPPARRPGRAGPFDRARRGRPGPPRQPVPARPRGRGHGPAQDLARHPDRRSPPPTHPPADDESVGVGVMNLVVNPQGQVRAIYDEAIALDIPGPTVDHPRQPRRARCSGSLDRRSPPRRRPRCSAPSPVAPRPSPPRCAWLEAHWLMPGQSLTLIVAQRLETTWTAVPMSPLS